MVALNRPGRRLESHVNSGDTSCLLVPDFLVAGVDFRLRGELGVPEHRSTPSVSGLVDLYRSGAQLGLFTGVGAMALCDFRGARDGRVGAREEGEGGVRVRHARASFSLTELAGCCFALEPGC